MALGRPAAALRDVPAQPPFFGGLALPVVALDFGFASSFAWSPITPFSGHTVNAGHFLQPATMAIGHRVMRASWKADEDTLEPTGEHRPQRTGNGLARFVEAQYRFGGGPDPAAGEILRSKPE